MTQFVEKPANKKSFSLRKPVYGIGINDSLYITSASIGGKHVQCPYYQAWSAMIERCYSKAFHKRRPTYIGCSVSPEWLTFSNFRKWMETQDWKGKALDKDLIIPNNKVYSQERCMFVSKKINSLLVDRSSDRGPYPIGVSFHKKQNKYRSVCSDNGVHTLIGEYRSPILAHKSYLKYKSNLIKRTAFEHEAVNFPKLQQALLRHSEIFKEKANNLFTDN